MSRVETVGTATLAGFALRTLERESGTEHYLTSTATAPSDATVEAAGAHFARVAATLAEGGVQVIQEKVYGSSQAREDVLAIRARELERCGLDPSPAVTYVECRPACGGELAGVQVWGVAPRERGRRVVETVAADGAPPGRRWSGPGFRLLYMPDFGGRAPDGTLSPTVTEQAQQMFTTAGEALKAHGLSYPQVVRTWIYLPRILDWYGEFNRVRNLHYAAEGLDGDTPGAVFPASTGIQGGGRGRECFMDVLALERERDRDGTVRVEPLRRSARQDKACDYGSAFSRGMSLEIEGRQTIFVSGTASINSAGDTVHCGNREAQCLETLLSIAALLEERGSGLRDISSATLFCKDVEVYRAFESVTRLLGVPPFPKVAVLADVCRPDLLVEIEAVALA